MSCVWTYDLYFRERSPRKYITLEDIQITYTIDKPWYTWLVPWSLTSFIQHNVTNINRSWQLTSVRVLEVHGICISGGAFEVKSDSGYKISYACMWSRRIVRLQLDLARVPCHCVSRTDSYRWNNSCGDFGWPAAPYFWYQQHTVRNVAPVPVSCDQDMPCPEPADETTRTSKIVEDCKRWDL